MLEARSLTERRTLEAKKIRSKMMKQGKDWSPRRGKELVPREDTLANNLTATQTVEQLIVVKNKTEMKITVVGNLGTGHEAQNVYDPKGIAPTVRENHGKTTKIILEEIPKTMSVRVFSMFSGIGGFEKGIENSGVKHEFIGYSEIDKYAISIYEHHYDGGHKNYGDATRIVSEQVPNFDFLVGGFPCQAFSIAGKRKGFDDTRGTLFFEIARILRDKRPRYLLLENVKGLLSHDDGKTFSTILGVLSDLGYDIQWEVLNSKNFGVPQNRERVLIVGYLGGDGRRQIFPIRKGNELHSGEDATEEGSQAEVDDQINMSFNQFPIKEGKREIARTVLSRDYKDPKLVKVADFRNDEGLRVRKEDLSPTLSTRKHSETDVSTMPHMIIRGRPKMPYKPGERELEFTEYKDACPALTENCAAGDQKNIVVQPPAALDLYNNKAHTDRTPALTEPHHNTLRLLQNSRIRRLTPVECERLQGFPDGWTKYGAFVPEENTKGKCAKQEVVAVITDGTKYSIGYNWCQHPQDICPRVEGEDYTKCKSICGQNSHAEVEALSNFKGDWSKAKLYIQGHTRICDDCKKLSRGIPVIKGLPLVEISDSQRYKCLGNAVTTNVICEVVKRMFKE